MINVVLALRSGRHFGRRDVELIAWHIHKHSDARLYCLTDIPLNIDGVTEIPLEYDWPKWWCRMELYSPKMKHLRPFLFVDLDTIVLGSLNELVKAVPKDDMYIPLEDFYQTDKLATGLLWMPSKKNKVEDIWNAWFEEKCPATEARMDYFLRKYIEPDAFWQQITDQVKSFKPKPMKFLKDPGNAIVVCLHGKPSIWDANLEWVKKYRS